MMTDTSCKISRRNAFAGTGSSSRVTTATSKRRKTSSMNQPGSMAATDWVVRAESGVALRRPTAPTDSARRLSGSRGTAGTAPTARPCLARPPARPRGGETGRGPAEGTCAGCCRGQMVEMATVRVLERFAMTPTDSRCPTMSYFTIRTVSKRVAVFEDWPTWRPRLL
ncbi:unnamed protein product [Prorocentrum cordatum]|uniref:Uncharacterized protein n=1 Tax=Prorocentrum cordatum TaxID=2364126 RepID=A0ABN9TUS0_9DINO|nr:unnamed protein product [Polarella glacialis]